MVSAVKKMKQARWYSCRYAPATTTAGYHHHHCYNHVYHHRQALCRRVLSRVGGPGFLQRLLCTAYGTLGVHR